MDKAEIKNLKKRYLLWFYKTVKEAADQVERKFTQVEIDRSIIEELKKLDKARQAGSLIAEFEAYVANKQKDGLNLKYRGREVRTEHRFLLFKLKAIEKVIVKELGKKGLYEIRSLYEIEMAERILKSREHR